MRLRLDHRLAFEHDPVQRHRFPRDRKLAGLDQREIENFVDQLQQIPPGLENLVDARLLRRCRQRGTGFQELAEAEDRVERGAKLVAHAGKEIRFGEVGLFRDGFGVGQFRFDLPALGQVPGQLGETARIAGLVPDRREYLVCPECRSVLANAPAFGLEPSLDFHRIEVALRRATFDVFTRIEP